MTMEQVQPFTHAMLEKTADTLELDFAFEWYQDDEGDVCLQFGQQEEWGCELTAWLMTDGEDENLYWIQVLSDREIPPHQWDAAVWLCNTWNRDWTFPKAYLDVNEDERRQGANEDDEPVTIHLEQYMDLEEGIHQALLDDMTLAVLVNALEFWKMAHADLGP